MDEKKQRELAVYNRHKSLYLFFRPLFIRIFNKRFNVVCDEIAFPDGPSLILSNHTTKTDQFFVFQALGNHHAYYVASENPFRNKFIRAAVTWLAGIIIHTKGYQSVSTAKNILKQLKLGANVCVFPEGNTTFDGRTAPVSSAIAKLAKVSGANLILLKMTGGYFSQPRWGSSKRRGQINFSNTVYTREQLKTMSVDEILAAINDGIYTDAYEEQKINQLSFTGKKLALGMESGIYMCPSCKRLSQLHSDDINIYCDCGYKLTYDEFGYLSESDGRKITITEVMTAQREYIRDAINRYKNSGIEDFLFEDDYDLYELVPNKRSSYVGKVHLKAFANHVEYSCDDKKGSICRNEVDSVVIFGKNTMTCFIKGKECGFELRGKFETNSLKYRDLFEG